MHAARWRPRIGLLLRRELRKKQYINFVSEFHLQMLADAVPIPIVRGTAERLSAYREDLHGLLMVEGDDVDPQYYKSAAETAYLIRETSPMKDLAEFRLCRYALRTGLPILGICRGSQLLNVVCGGQLYNDVMAEIPSNIDHTLTSDDPEFRHSVCVLPDTPLSEWYDKADSLMVGHWGQTSVASRGRRGLTAVSDVATKVNSYHHQGIRTLAKRFRPMAVADDGLVEGFYDPSHPFIVGLQFHPERLTTYLEGNRRVYKAFVEACRTVHQRTRTRNESTESPLSTLPSTALRIPAGKLALARRRISVRLRGDSSEPFRAVAFPASASLQDLIQLVGDRLGTGVLRLTTKAGAEIDDMRLILEDDELYAEGLAGAP